VSGLVEEKSRVVMRRMLVIVVKMPRAKTTISAAFWLLGSCEVQMGCMGSARMRTSVAMEKPALAYQFLVKSIQVPATVLSQARGTGLHCQTEAAKVATM